MKAPVQFDVDGVIADFVKGYLREAKVLRLYDGEAIGDADNVQYGTHHLVGRTADRVLWGAIVASPSFWESLPLAVPRDTLKRINALQDERDVYFATNRSGFHSRYQTQQWLELRGIKSPTVIVTARKGDFAKAIKAGYSIEDKAGNAVYIAYESPNTTSCLINRPYNRFPQEVLGSKVRRVESVDAFLDLIEAEGR